MPSQDKKLKKNLSMLDLTLIGIGAAIGSGWLFGVQYAANDAGPAAIVGWAIGAVALIFIALVYAELSSMLPAAGGVVRYPDYSHGSILGFLMSIATIIAYSTIPPIEAEAAVQYLAPKAFFNAKSGLPNFTGWLIEALLVVLFFLMNYYGIKILARINNVVTIFKVIVPLLTFITLIFSIHVSNFTSKGFAPYGFHGILTAVATSGIIFSMLGFRQAVDMSAEAKNPGRDVPRAIILELVIVAIVYILVQAVFIGAVPAHAFQHGWAKLSFQGPLVDVSLILGLTWLAWFMEVSAVVSPLGAGWVYFASTARAVLGFSNNGYFFNLFSKVDEKTGIPRAAMWLTLILGIIWTGPFPIWSKLVAFCSSASVLTYVVGPVSAMVFRRHAADAHRPVRLGGLPVIAILAFIVGSNIIYWTGWSNVQPLIILEFIALVVFFLFSLFAPRLRENLGKSFVSSIWILVYMIFMYVVSYYGSFGGKGKLAYPLDIIVVAVGSIIFYFWGIASGRRTASLETAIQEASEHTSTSTANL
ncbi:APC family permease [Alicyclobacillus tolerans]|uniref:Amino acid/polyamine/organocation transporter, APC superfamily n=2 Tax=Alicyclobacillus tolerans TaxID=90970 RepID=A0A1M6MYC7_9BACL|nr:MULTISPECIES: APC family permease [Alicyclobacillus]MDP9727716.1 amino acid transporter [Alicyclobacillus tengchongensis]SHJ88449.1 amino acid/polyamine/organocation transporter, APC superfamily [Alicyclobacillus montanus]